MKSYIGIDPGSSSGGISIIEADGTVKNYQIKKLTELDIVNILSQYKENSMAFLESVHAMPGQGVTSMFTFGQNFGFIKGVLTALGIPYDSRSPQTWLKMYGMKKEKTESKIEWKKRLRQRAEMLFPGVKITSETADSLLMANFIKHVH